MLGKLKGWSSCILSPVVCKCISEMAEGGAVTFFPQFCFDKL